MNINTTCQEEDVSPQSTNSSHHVVIDTWHGTRKPNPKKHRWHSITFGKLGSSFLQSLPPARFLVKWFFSWVISLDTQFIGWLTTDLTSLCTHVAYGIHTNKPISLPCRVSVLGLTIPRYVDINEQVLLQVGLFISLLKGLAMSRSISTPLLI